MKTPCVRCAIGAAGELGHDDLESYISGPYPGQHIFKCGACDERWIRHHGTTERFGWTRYEFPARPVRKFRTTAGQMKKARLAGPSENSTPAFAGTTRLP